MTKHTVKVYRNGLRGLIVNVPKYAIDLQSIKDGEAMKDDAVRRARGLLSSTVVAIV
jgi:hypothetical protein